MRRMWFLTAWKNAGSFQTSMLSSTQKNRFSQSSSEMMSNISESKIIGRLSEHILARTPNRKYKIAVKYLKSCIQARTINNYIHPWSNKWMNTCNFIPLIDNWTRSEHLSMFNFESEVTQSRKLWSKNMRLLSTSPFARSNSCWIVANADNFVTFPDKQLCKHFCWKLRNV